MRAILRDPGMDRPPRRPTTTPATTTTPGLVIRGSSDPLYHRAGRQPGHVDHPSVVRGSSDPLYSRRAAKRAARVVILQWSGDRPIPSTCRCTTTSCPRACLQWSGDRPIPSTRPASRPDPPSRRTFSGPGIVRSPLRSGPVPQTRPRRRPSVVRGSSDPLYVASESQLVVARDVLQWSGDRPIPSTRRLPVCGVGHAAPSVVRGSSDPLYGCVPTQCTTSNIAGVCERSPHRESGPKSCSIVKRRSTTIISLRAVVEGCAATGSLAGTQDACHTGLGPPKERYRPFPWMEAVQIAETPHAA